ncbi:hypothetical protein KL938_004490 [Ogataea parapolymorpha]|nr:hypothetical protein KL938_004490 [Ogataea parapolymorpha]
MSISRDDDHPRPKRARSGKPKKETPPAKRRVRTGCLTCRRKHKKCDENRPKCDFCTAKGLECVWPEEVKKNVFVNNSFKDFCFSQSKHRDRFRKPTDFDLPSSLAPLDYHLGPDDPRTRKKAYSLDVADHYLSAFDGYSRKNEYLDAPLTTAYPLLETSESPLSGLFNAPQELPSQLTRTPSFGASSLSYFDTLQSYSMNPSLSSGSNDKTSTASSVSSDMSLAKKDADFEHRYSFAEPQKKSRYGLDYYDLPNTLNDLMCLFIATKDSTSGSKLPNNETIFEIFTDKSTMEAPSIDDHEMMLLMETYIDQIAHFLNKSDETQCNIFMTKIPELAHKFPSLKYAILALASRHLEKVRPDYSGEKTLQYYTYSLQQLSMCLNSDKNTPEMVATCVLLCYFEILSTNPDSWHSRLENCGSMLKVCHINARSETELEKALFWSFAALDIGCCAVGDRKTVVHAEDWFGTDAPSCPTDTGTALQSMLYLSCQIFQLVSSNDAQSEFDSCWKSLWKQLGDWERTRSSNMRGFCFKRDNSFPETLFSSSTALCANQLFHTCCILMLQTKPRLVKLCEPEKQERTPDTLFQSAIKTEQGESVSTSSLMSRSQIWHAKQIIGINVCNMKNASSRSLGCQILSLQAIWIAGKLISSAHEHSIILQLLRKLESWSSMSMDWREKQLTEFWKREC